MNCFVGLILIAGTYINPCLVTHMVNIDMGEYDYRHKGQLECYIEFNSGNAWSGTDNTRVPISCEQVQKAIKEGQK